jgi:hypothetical protein
MTSRQQQLPLQQLQAQQQQRVMGTRQREEGCCGI